MAKKRENDIVKAAKKVADMKPSSISGVLDEPILDMARKKSEEIDEEKLAEIKRKGETSEEKARNIQWLETRWAEGYQECTVIMRRDLQVNPAHLHKVLRVPQGDPRPAGEGKGFCVLIYG